MIYFIRCALTSRVKIGFSERPWSRLVKMQVDCPTELVLAAAIEGDKTAEAALHARFADHHVRGEWFADTGPLKAFIAEQPLLARPKGRRKLRLSRTKLCAWITERGLTDEIVSAAIGISRPTICRLRGGKRRPGIDTALKLAQYTGIPCEELFTAEAA